MLRHEPEHSSVKKESEIPPLWGGNTHISQKSILWESIFDSFSLKGEAFGLKLSPCFV